MVQRVLLAATGKSPQVVTETFFKLATAPKEHRFVPTEVHLVTTTEGERAAGCLLDRSLAHNPLLRLCRDYSVRPPQLVKIHLLHGAEGPLEDLRTADDSARAGDAMLEVVRALTARKDTQVHFSIAGGRKTMGYLLGLSASLLARPQDQMSHVLVREPYEAMRDFYYPEPPPLEPCPIDLPELPFVRLRSFLPDRLLENASLMHMSAFIDGLLTRPKVQLRLAEAGPATVRTELTLAGLTIHLPPKAFALYWLFAKQAARARPWIDADCDAEAVRHDYLRVYRLSSGGGQRYQDEAAFLMANDGRFRKRDFDNALARMTKHLKDTLGERGAAVFAPASSKVAGRLQYGLLVAARDIAFDAPAHLL